MSDRENDSSLAPSFHPFAAPFLWLVASAHPVHIAECRRRYFEQRAHRAVPRTDGAGLTKKFGGVNTASRSHIIDGTQTSLFRVFFFSRWMEIIKNPLGPFQGWSLKIISAKVW